MWSALLLDLLGGLGRLDVDGDVAGDLRDERTGFTTGVLGLKDDC